MNTQKAYQYIIKNGFNDDDLINQYNLSSKTVNNYNNGKFPKTNNSSSSKVIKLLGMALEKLSEVQGLDPKREIEKMTIKDIGTLRDFILKFSDAKEYESAEIFMNIAIENRVHNVRKKLPIEIFRNKYGKFNDENLINAAAEEPELVKKIIIGDSIDALAKGHALVALAIADKELKNKKFVELFINHDSPFLQEATYMALFQYYNEESCDEDLTKFITFLEKAYSDCEYDGVKNKINKIINTIKLIK